MSLPLKNNFTNKSNVSLNSDTPISEVVHSLFQSYRSLIEAEITSGDEKTSEATSQHFSCNSNQAVC